MVEEFYTSRSSNFQLFCRELFVLILPMENLFQSLRGTGHVMFLNTNQLNVCKIVTVQWLLAAILLLKQLQYYPLFIRTKEPTKQGILESHNGVMAFTA